MLALLHFYDQIDTAVYTPFVNDQLLPCLQSTIRVSVSNQHFVEYIAHRMQSPYSNKSKLLV